MIGKDDLERLLEYTIWANHRMMRVAVLLPLIERDQVRFLLASLGELPAVLVGRHRRLEEVLPWEESVPRKSTPCIVRGVSQGEA